MKNLKTELKNIQSLLINKCKTIREYAEFLQMSSSNHDYIKGDLTNYNYNDDGLYCHYLDCYFSNDDDFKEILKINIKESRDDNILDALIGGYIHTEHREYYENLYNGTIIDNIEVYKNINILDELETLIEEVEENIGEHRRI